MLKSPKCYTHTNLKTNYIQFSNYYIKTEIPWRHNNDAITTCKFLKTAHKHYELVFLFTRRRLEFDGEDDQIWRVALASLPVASKATCCEKTEGLEMPD